MGLMLGLGVVIEVLRPFLTSALAHAVHIAVGACLLGYAVLAPSRSAGPSRVRLPESGQLTALFGLGIVVTIIELPTAFPYFGAIALLTASDLTPIEWLPLLVLYYAVFVLPPLAVFAAHRRLGSRLESRFGRWQERLQHEARQTFLWIVGIVGFFLIAGGIAFFADLD